MTIAAGLALAAMTVGVQSAPNPPKGGVYLVVYDCYTGTPPIAVEVNGKPLGLTPAAARDDSVGLCYDATLALPSKLRVRVRRGGVERVFDLRLRAGTRAVMISASAMTATASNRVPMFD